MSEDMTQSEDRLNPELEREIKNSYLNQKSDFVFIHKIEDMKNGHVEVTFNKPFGDEKFRQIYRLPDNNSSEIYPCLTDLYKAANADIQNPDSILHKGIPIKFLQSNKNSEYKARNNQKSDRPVSQKTESRITDEDRSYEIKYSQLENTNLYQNPDEECISEIMVPILLFYCLFSSFALLYIIFYLGGLLGFVLSFLLIFTLVYIPLELFSKGEIPPPEDAEEIKSLSEVEFGDSIILEKSPVYDESSRHALNVTVATGYPYRVKGVTDSGEVVRLKSKNKEGNNWTIDSKESDYIFIKNSDIYNKIYRINSGEETELAN